jgi:hypothetical protein
MQVCESTEIIYDKRVVDFYRTDKQCTRSIQQGVHKVLARKFHDTHDIKVKDDGKLKGQWVFVAR